MLGDTQVRLQQMTSIISVMQRRCVQADEVDAAVVNAWRQSTSRRQVEFPACADDNISCVQLSNMKVAAIWLNTKCPIYRLGTRHNLASAQDWDRSVLPSELLPRMAGVAHSKVHSLHAMPLLRFMLKRSCLTHQTAWCRFRYVCIESDRNDLQDSLQDKSRSGRALT